jgi:Zn-dependent protease with chaperone function
MNFFAHQEHARAQTRSMLVLFALAVLAVVLALNGLAYVAMGSDVADREQRNSLFMLVTIVTLSVIGFGSLYKTLTLRAGGGAIARALGGTQISHDERDPSYRRLMNIVEEMAIASGIPCPEVYVLAQVDAINAFAAGFTIADAAVTVTQGALAKLSRDELQGVIAHEFSHIVNGDMRLNLRLTGVLFGLMAIGVIGREVMFSARGSKDGVPLVVFGAVLMGLGFLGLYLGRLIKASISRSREFAADATAVQFTRMSSGIAGALKKIGGFQSGSGVAHAKTEEVAHMLFADGAAGRSAASISAFSGMGMATHPPLDERILRLDPAFQPEQWQRLRSYESQLRLSDEGATSAAELLGGAGRASFAPGISNAQRSAPAVFVEEIVAHVAQPTAAHVDYAQACVAGTQHDSDPLAASPSKNYADYAEMRQAITPILLEAARSRTRASMLVLGLALSSGREPAALECIQRQLGSDARAEVAALLPALIGLPRSFKLPLACIAFPTLKAAPPAQLAQWLAALDAVVLLDGTLELFEYCLVAVMRQSVNDAAQPANAATMGTGKLSGCVQAIECVLSTLARYGHTSTDSTAAFAAGAARLSLPLVFRAASSSTVGQAEQISLADANEFEQSLHTCDQLAPFAKRQLLTALVAVMNFDGHIQAGEAELLRVVCLALHCPLPPMLALPMDA